MTTSLHQNRRAEAAILWPLWLSVLGLMIISAMFIFSTTGSAELARGASWYQWTATRQVIAFAIGILAVLGVLVIGFNLLFQRTKLGLALRAVTSNQESAALAGIKVPKLCATDSLEAFGSCRVCLVEIEGRKGYPASCTTPVENPLPITRAGPSGTSRFASLAKILGPGSGAPAIATAKPSNSNKRH